MKPLTLIQMANHYKGTGLTPTALRRGVVSGEIHSIRVGKKYLLTVEAVERWLSGEPAKPTETNGGIRRVAN